MYRRGLALIVVCVPPRSLDQAVKSWGTEGRLPGDQQIPPSDHIHLCVNFRGEDIKDLHVHEVGLDIIVVDVIAVVVAVVVFAAAAVSYLYDRLRRLLLLLLFIVLVGLLATFVVPGGFTPCLCICDRLYAQASPAAIDALLDNQNATWRDSHHTCTLFPHITVRAPLSRLLNKLTPLTYPRTPFFLLPDSGSLRPTTAPPSGSPGGTGSDLGNSPDDRDDGGGGFARSTRCRSWRRRRGIRGSSSRSRGEGSGERARCGSDCGGGCARLFHDEGPGSCVCVERERGG